MDLSDATFVAAKCLRIFIAAERAVGPSGGFALVADPGGPVAQAIALIGAGERLPVYGSRDIAVGAVRASRS